MRAITIRNLPDSVHNDLRQMAVSGNLSVEALVRNLLNEAARAKQLAGQSGQVTGLADAAAPWRSEAAPKAAVELWGAMRGCVRVPDGTDLTAPAGEDWEAAR